MRPCRLVFGDLGVQIVNGHHFLGGCYWRLHDSGQFCEKRGCNVGNLDCVEKLHKGSHPKLYILFSPNLFSVNGHTCSESCTTVEVLL